MTVRPGRRLARGWPCVAAEWVVGIMDWWMIRIEPLSLAERACLPGLSYELCLPLISDGRVSLPLYRAEQAKARFREFQSERVRNAGQIELRDNQWACVREIVPQAEAEIARFMCKSLDVGELVGLRPTGRPIRIFQVKARTPLVAGSGDGS